MAVSSTLAATIVGCGSVDCATLATCPESSSKPAEDSIFDGGRADAYQNPTADGPHCQGMGRACGGDDCCASDVVPGGTFRRSYDGVLNGGYADANFVATVDDFRLDRYEVTIGRFRAFLAGYGSPINGTGKNPNDPTDPGWQASSNALLPSASKLASLLSCERQRWTEAPGSDETKPVACLTWYEAFAFCIWDGGRLPTEAEWNYAAAGGSEQRAFPWSSPPYSLVIDDSHAVHGPEMLAVAPVGSKPNGHGKWGHADLAGNVSEWTRDLWARPYVTPCENCSEQAANSPARVLRGGAAGDAAEFLRTGRRDYASPEARRSTFGVRCARKV